MVNQITPSYTTIGDIFEKNFLFEVPKYQRYYSWEDEQIEDFIKDIDNIYIHMSDGNPIEHFFGGIVVVYKPVAGSNRSQRELIDGQQRITTTILLVIALIRKYETLINDENRELIENRIIKLKSKYLFYNDEINRKPVTVDKLVLSNADAKFFKDLTTGTESEASRDSHKRISRAYKRITRFVDSKIDAIAKCDEKIDGIANMEILLHKNCTIIFIDSQTRESAYKLFQVLNDRGAGLTEGDLLKSKTLESLEKHYNPKQVALEQDWDEILQDDPKTTEEFLRYYYASVCGKRVGRTSLYDDFLKCFFPQLVDKDIVSEEEEATKVVDTVKTILTEIKVYRNLINGVWPYTSRQPITEWDRKRLDILVNYLGFDIVYPLLLAAVHLKEKMFAEMVHILEKFMFRYKSVCNLAHQKISDIFMNEAVKIRNNTDTYRLTDLKRTLQSFVESECTDAVFKAGLENLKYRTNGNNKQLKYLLSTLNEHYDWYVSGAVGKPKPSAGLVTNFDNVTIEHIVPQSSATVQNGFEGEKIHHLFNLTVLTTSENDHAENKPYCNKKSIYEGSNYVINKYFSEVDSWDISKALEWQNYIVDFACKVFVI